MPTSSRDFHLIVLGQIVSILGSALLRFALSLYVLDLTSRADIFAVLFAVSNLPLLLAPVGGAIADRFNRRHLMVIYDISSSIIIFTLLFLLPISNPVLIGGIMVLLSIISTMYTPTVLASIPLLVREEELEQANGIVNGVQALANIAAPVLGGILYGIIGIDYLIILSGIAFFTSAIVATFLRIPFTKRAQDDSIIPILIQDMKEGFYYVQKHSFILKAMILASFLNLLLTPLFVVGAPIILRMTMDSNNTMYGIGMGIIPTATIMGALIIGLLTKKITMKTLYKGFLFITVLLLPLALATTTFFLGIGYYPSFTLFLVSSLCIAMTMTILSIFVLTAVQKRTPNEHLGKVMAIITAVAQSMAPLGQILYGFVFETFQLNMYIPILFVSVAMSIVTLITKKLLRNEE